MKPTLKYQKLSIFDWQLAGAKVIIWFAERLVVLTDGSGGTDGVVFD